MEIARSATDRHDITVEQIEHALRNVIDRFEMEDGVTMYVGPDHTGQLLEIGVVEGPRVIHAMPARRQFLR